MNEILVAKALGEIVLKGVVKRFGQMVFERWTRYRANRFLEGLCVELEMEFQGKIKNENVDNILNEILADEKKSEVLFDAYRSVSLSKSKKIGPRVIGLITARLIIESRSPDAKEEDFLTVAEQLSDDELLSLVDFVNETDGDMRLGAKNIKEVSGFISIKLEEESIDSNWKPEYPINLTAIDLRECYGLWALKMKNLGIFSEKIEERNFDYREDSERHIDQDGSVREIKWTLVVPSYVRDLSVLIGRAADIVEAEQARSGSFW